VCPYCKGSGVRPSVEYLALRAFRRIKSEAAKGQVSDIAVTLPPEVTSYLLNQKRSKLSRLEELHDVSVAISGDPSLLWGEFHSTTVKREPVVLEAAIENGGEEAKPAARKPARRRRRPRQAKPGEQEQLGEQEQPAPVETAPVEPPAAPPETAEKPEPKKSIVSKVYDFFR